MARSSTEMVGVGGGLRLRERVVEVLLQDNQVHPTGGQDPHGGQDPPGGRDPPGGQYLTWWAMVAWRVRGTCLLVVEAAVCSPGDGISRFQEYFYFSEPVECEGTATRTCSPWSPSQSRKGARSRGSLSQTGCCRSSAW